MENYRVFLGFIILIHGFYSLYSSYKGKKSNFFALPSSSFIPKKIFGKHYNRIENFVWGSMELFIGFHMIKFLFLY